MKNIILLLSILLLGISCREDDFDVLPRETQEGLNTFGCIINGELLVPKTGSPSITGDGADGLDTDYMKDSLRNSLRPPFFAIWATNVQDKGGDAIYLYIPSLYSVRTYQLHESNGYQGIDSPPHPHAFVNYYDKKDNFIRYLSIRDSGEINILKFDTVNTIISGTFHLRMVDAETRMDTIEITQGVFDINWATLNCGKPRKQPCQS